MCHMPHRKASASSGCSGHASGRGSAHPFSSQFPAQQVAVGGWHLCTQTIEVLSSLRWADPQKAGVRKPLAHAPMQVHPKGSPTSGLWASLCFPLRSVCLGGAQSFHVTFFAAD